MLLSESQEKRKSEDVFNNNAEKVSKFPKRRTRICSSGDELDDEAESNKTREKPKPKLPNKPQKLPSIGLNSDAHSPAPPKSPAFHNSMPRSPALRVSAPRSPVSPGAPGSYSTLNPVTKSPTVKPSVAKKPPPVSPKPSNSSRSSNSSNDSRTIHIANKPSVVSNRPSVAPKPTYIRKSAPLSEGGKLTLRDKVEDRKRSSSLSAAQEATMSHQDEICKTNSIIVLPKERNSRNSNAVEQKKSGDAEQAQITYPMSILRRKPVRTGALKSCSDLMDNDDQDLESLSGESQTSEFRDSIFESPMLKQYKKSQHFLIDQNSIPDYHKSSTSNASRPESNSSERNALGYDPSILRKNQSGTRTASTDSSAGEESPNAKTAPRFSKNTTVKPSQVASPQTRKKVGLTRSNATRTKSPPTKIMQHKSMDPLMFKQLKTKPSTAQMVRHSDASGGYANSDVFDEEDEDSDSNHENVYEKIWVNWETAPPHRKYRETLTPTEEDFNFDFPPVPPMPFPRLEMRFDSPFDEIRRFLAYNRGPNEVFPVPRKSERGGKAMSKLKLILSRLAAV